MSFCQSYLAGNFREVWDELNGMGSALFEDDLLVADAKCVVAETMLRVKSNIATIVGRLRKINYRFMVEMMATAFGPPLGTDSQSPYAPPDPDVASILEQLEQSVGPIPLVLRGWFEIVGSVDLIGLHPTLSPRDASILTDPLAVMSPREIVSELSGAPVGSMRLPMFPSERSKGGMSGGALHTARMGPGMDAIIDFATPQSFISYLRHSIEWAGFPGLAKTTPPPELEQLRAGLLRF